MTILMKLYYKWISRNDKYCINPYEYVLSNTMEHSLGMAGDVQSSNDVGLPCRRRLLHN